MVPYLGVINDVTYSRVLTHISLCCRQPVPTNGHGVNSDLTRQLA